MVTWKLFRVCWFFFYCLRFAFWKFLWMKVFKGRPDHNNRSAYRYRYSAPKVESLDPLPRMPRGVWVMCVATGKSLNVIPIHKHNHSHNQNPSTNPKPKPTGQTWWGPRLANAFSHARQFAVLCILSANYLRFIYIELGTVVRTRAKLNAPGDKIALRVGEIVSLAGITIDFVYPL